MENEPRSKPQFQEPPPYPPQPVQFPPAPSHPIGYTGVPPNPCKAPVSGFPVPPNMQINTEAWTTGLCGCLDNPSNAIVTLFLPCVTFGQIVEIVDQGHTSCVVSGLLYGMLGLLLGWPLPCILSCTYRTKLRNMFGISNSPAPDCLVHSFCELCALCQEYRELQNKGFKPSIGWVGNVNRIQMEPGGMVPPMNQKMIG